MAAHDPRKRADALARSLTDLLAPVVADAGLHLEGVETTRAGRYSVVRVLVDLADGPGDLDIDALGPVTAAVSQALDEADPVKGQYTLEVSTPGAERELTTLRHFRRAGGRRAGGRPAGEELPGAVPAADADSDSSKGSDGGTVSIEVDGTARRVALKDVLDARMVVAGL